MKKNDPTSPFNRAMEINDQLAFILAGIIGFVTAGILFMALPADAQIVIVGILSLIGAAIVAHLVQEKFNAMSDSNEKSAVENNPIPLHASDYMVERRRQLKVA